MQVRYLKVIKKDGTVVDFDKQKIISAIHKSANRVMVDLTQEDDDYVCDVVLSQIKNKEQVDVPTLHKLVEAALEELNPKVAKSYRDYRNYKVDFVHMLDKVYEKAQAIRYIGDRDNANTDSTLVSTQRSLIYNELSSALYKKFFLNIEERQAMQDGYIYIHDRSARLDTINCCLADISSILTGGFEMGNIWYNEPKSLDVAFDVISDIAMSMAAQQYGGYTMPRIDTILAPYAEKSYQKYLEEYFDIISKLERTGATIGNVDQAADEYATNKVRRDFEQGFQSWEYRFNTVGSSRGDYPFIAISFGIGTSKWETMATEVCLQVRKGGQGKNGFKKPVLFPKLCFLYDENIHGEGKELENLFDLAIECSSKCMYPKH